ncbi:23S rRNA (uracil(1939)-C(5))-methyltransferase RlmD [Anaerolentibacter hominis]|uniref:23S rRNA (uracil(1939)-C(5))-methyltransferase RlmD n=1 Tax=Anaerolentibacter hominis TaxID=3079009 RepID=UPI0031B81152
MNEEKKVKKGQVYEGIVDHVDFPNKGIIYIENEKVTVKNCIPGQKIRFAVNKVKNRRYEGRLLEVLEKSPLEETKDICPKFGICGGCSYQSLPYDYQLSMKVEQVRKLLNQVCDSYEFEGILRSPLEYGYRNKMEFSFGDEVKDGPLSLGLHKKGSFHDIITADCCKLVHPDFNQILSSTLSYFQKKGTDFYHKLSHTGFLRHLVIRRGARTGELLVNLVTTSQEQMDLRDLTDQLLALPLEGRITGFLHTINDSAADVVKCDSIEVLYGQDYFYEEVLGLKFKISPFSFFQTNSLGAEVLYSKARDYVGETKDKLIFDLYSGTGTIAQLLAPVAKKVIGVEIVEEAVEAARENAALNGLTNCEFIAGDVLKVIDSIEEKPDMIVLDPPRDGIHPKALGKIIDYGVDRLVYISCKPTSLARDLVVLQDQGYRVEKVCCVDMFPGTGHVETVTLLVRKP